MFIFFNSVILLLSLLLFFFFVLILFFFSSSSFFFILQYIYCCNCIESLDEYFQKTTCSMEATAIAGLEWACVYSWASNPDGNSVNWVTWMYSRVAEIKSILIEQRLAWAVKEQDLQVRFNQDRKAYFLSIRGEARTRQGNPYDSDEDSLFDEREDSLLLVGGEGIGVKKPRLFKDGIL